ncbi:MAG: 4Fe-4S binding protein [Bacillota bacterium]|nr:4Fe-4S binding protein [Bacillota bacterium]
MPGQEDVAGEIRELAQRRGFRVGFARAEDMEQYAGIHVGWIIRQPTRRPAEVLPGARAAIVVAAQIRDPAEDLAVRLPGGGWRYPGYGTVAIRAREVCNLLVARGHRAVLTPDAISLKNLARLTGLGTFGKNSLLITPDCGPDLRLEGILTDAVLPPDHPWEGDLCGDCSACVEACPVGALEPFRVDDEKCLVGLTLGGPGRMPPPEVVARHEPPLTAGSHIMCRACQDACPRSRPRDIRFLFTSPGPSQPTQDPQRRLQ